MVKGNEMTANICRSGVFIELGGREMKGVFSVLYCIIRMLHWFCILCFSLLYIHEQWPSESRSNAITC